MTEYEDIGDDYLQELEEDEDEEIYHLDPGYVWDPEDGTYTDLTSLDIRDPEYIDAVIEDDFPIELEQIRIHGREGTLYVYTPYDNKYRLLVRKRLDARWDPKQKCWKVREGNIRALREILQECYGCTGADGARIFFIPEYRDSTVRPCEIGDCVFLGDNEVLQCISVMPAEYYYSIGWRIAFRKCDASGVDLEKAKALAEKLGICHAKKKK